MLLTQIFGVAVGENIEEKSLRGKISRICRVIRNSCYNYYCSGIVAERVFAKRVQLCISSLPHSRDTWLRIKVEERGVFESHLRLNNVPTYDLHLSSNFFFTNQLQSP